MPDLSTSQWLVAALAGLCIGLAKGGFGGVGMLAVVLMASVLPARESTGAVLPLLILADVFAVLIYRKHASFRLVLRLVPPALIGVICGWWLMPNIPLTAFAALIGWLTLVLILLAIVQQLLPSLPRLAIDHPGLAWPFGWLAGLTTMLANAAGPVMAIYLLACRLPKMEFVGTAAWYFFVVNLLKVPFSLSLGLINVSSLSLNAALAPLVISGLFLGRWLLGKVSQRAFEWLMIVLSLLGAVRLIVA